MSPTSSVEGNVQKCMPLSLSEGSIQQGRKSLRVKVPLPSIARFGRVAYPLLGEVTNRDMRGRTSHGGLGWKKHPTVGTTWGVSKLGGLNIKEVPAAPKIKACIEVVLREHVTRADPLRKWGRPMPRGKTSKCTMRTAGVRGQAFKKRFAERTLGKA